MKKFLYSESFVSTSTTLSFLLCFVAGILLGFQPNTSGEVGGTYIISGEITTTYIFQLHVALGYWLLGLVLTFAVYLLCVLVRAQILKDTKGNKDIPNA